MRPDGLAVSRQSCDHFLTDPSFREIHNNQLETGKGRKGSSWKHVDALLT